MCVHVRVPRSPYGLVQGNWERPVFNWLNISKQAQSIIEAFVLSS